jgi:hypothetical protein
MDRQVAIGHATRGASLPGALAIEGVVFAATVLWSVKSRRWLPVALTVACLGVVNLAGEVFFHGIPVY